MLKKISALFLALIIFGLPLTAFAEPSGMEQEAAQKYDSTERKGGLINSAKDGFGIVKKEGPEQFDFEAKSSKDTGDADDAIKDFSKGTYSVGWTILNEIRRNSFPVCLVLIIIGSLITNILGPRNMVRKKFGVSLMFGALTFWVVAQVVPVVFWLMIQ